MIFPGNYGYVKCDLKANPAEKASVVRGSGHSLELATRELQKR